MLVCKTAYCQSITAGKGKGIRKKIKKPIQGGLRVLQRARNMEAIHLLGAGTIRPSSRSVDPSKFVKVAEGRE